MEETLNESTTESTSVANTEAENGENPFADGDNPIAGGGGGFGDPLAPDEGYEYDFGEDSGLPMRTPFDQLLEFEEFDNVGDIFGDLDPSDNPFAGGTPSDDAQPSTVDDNASEGNSNTDDNSTDSNDVDSDPMMNADFSGIDTGADNTDNGNGNNFIGDSEGESGSNNQAEGNGNWFYGNDNQVNGNGNWNLSGDSDTPFDSTFEGENNPLTGGNPLDVGESDGMSSDALGGNNPAFAGGSTTPAPVGEGEIPDTAENPTGNQNTVNGNGNWNFGSNNDTSGNGNWNFGDGNEVSEGNGNWNLGDDNEVSGNGNRPSGDDNSISGNGNRVTGDGNDINGNRFSLDENDLNVVGNGDRYFQTDTDGNVSLVSDESKSDPNYTFDFEGVVETSEDGEVDELINGGELSFGGDVEGQDVIDLVYGSLDIYESSNTTGTGSALDGSDAIDGAAEMFPEGEVLTDTSDDVLPVI